MKSSNLPPPVNPAEGWVTPQNSGGDGGYNAGGRRYGNNMQQQSYPNQQQQYVSSDAQMRARPLNAFQPTNSYNMVFIPSKYEGLLMMFTFSSQWE